MWFPKAIKQMGNLMENVVLPADYAASANAQKNLFQAQFDQAFHVPANTPQRAVLQSLIDQIGTDDWEGEGFPSPENQRDLSIRFHWGHTHRFGDDLLVKGRMGDRHIRLMSEFHAGFGLAPDHFKDAQVLDIGCWTGGTTLSLKMLGAGAITAYEEVRKYARTTETLLKDVFGYSDVTCVDRSLYDLKEGTFDTVYIPGVVYHLSDPVLALRLLYNRLRDGGDILVESAGINQPGVLCKFKGNREHFGGAEGSMTRGGWAWFWPTPECLGAWLIEAGFEDVRVYWSPVSNRCFAHGIRRGFNEITRAGLSRPDVT